MKVKKILLGLVFTCIYMFPIVFLIYESKTEMKEYESVDLKIEEKSYGEPCQTLRQDVKSNIILDAEGVSSKTDIVETNKKDYIWNVDIGDEIKKGECIGKTGKDELRMNYNGIIKEICKDYVRIEIIDKAQYETYISPVDVSYFKGNLKDEQGNKVENIKISNIQKNGKIRIVFSIQNRSIQYGEKVTGLVLSNGKVYKNVLTIEKKCVKQKKDGKNYVRIIDDDGNFVGEQEVQLGYEYDEYVCVTGLDEDMWCDGGYYLFENKEGE